jgi:hypothetical protein
VGGTEAVPVNVSKRRQRRGGPALPSSQPPQVRDPHTPFPLPGQKLVAQFPPTTDSWPWDPCRRSSMPQRYQIAQVFPASDFSFFFTRVCTLRSAVDHGFVFVTLLRYLTGLRHVILPHLVFFHGRLPIVVRLRRSRWRDLQSGHRTQQPSWNILGADRGQVQQVQKHTLDPLVVTADVSGSCASPTLWTTFLHLLTRVPGRLALTLRPRKTRD